MVFRGSEAHVVKEVFLVVQRHVKAILFENRVKNLVRDQIGTPIRELSLALETETVQCLWLNVVSFEQLQNSREQILRVARILVKLAA